MVTDENREKDPVPAAAPKEVLTGPSLVVGPQRWDRPEARLSPREAFQILGGAGFLLLVVSWTHLITTFFPYRFGIASWEYAAVTQSIDVMPLGVVGLALAAAASLMNGWRRRGQVLIVAIVINVLLLLIMVGLVVLDLPIAWKAVPEAMHRDLVKSSVKAIGFAVLFIWFQIWVAGHLLRARRVMF